MDMEEMNGVMDHEENPATSRESVKEVKSMDTIGLNSEDIIAKINGNNHQDDLNLNHENGKKSTCSSPAQSDVQLMDTECNGEDSIQEYKAVCHILDKNDTKACESEKNHQNSLPQKIAVGKHEDSVTLKEPESENSTTCTDFPNKILLQEECVSEGPSNDSKIQQDVSDGNVPSEKADIPVEDLDENSEKCGDSSSKTNAISMMEKGESNSSTENKKVRSAEIMKDDLKVDAAKSSEPDQDDIIVLDDGDDDDDKEQEIDKKTVENGKQDKAHASKSPIIVSYCSLSNDQPVKINETSASSASKVTAPQAKESSGAKSQQPPPIPEFAKDLRPLAMNLCTIGMNLVREHVYNDLIKIQTKKLAQNKLNDMAEKQLEIIKTAAKTLEAENIPFKMQLEECKPKFGPDCGFLTESHNILELHKEYPHRISNNFHCTRCDYFTTRKQDYIFHTEAIHGKPAKFVAPFGYLVCCFCKFETDSPKGFNKHVVRCAKTFNLKRNLEPSPSDCDIPLKKPKVIHGKPVTRPQKTFSMITNAGPPAAHITPRATQANVPSQASTRMISNNQPAVSISSAIKNAKVFPGQKPNSIITIPTGRKGTVAEQLNKAGSGGIRPAGMINVAKRGPAPTQYLFGNTYYSVVNLNGQLVLQPSSLVAQNATGTVNAAGLRPSILPLSQSVASSASALRPSPVNQQVVRSIITPKTQEKSVKDALLNKRINVPPLVRAPTPVRDTTILAPPTGIKPPAGFKICEICGGFVKDLESLRIHFFFKHNVEIPKEVDEPGFSCFLCVNPKSFWTIKGLEMHQKKEHGMGTTASSNSITKKKEGSVNKPIILSPEKKSVGKSSPNMHSCYLCGAKTDLILKHLLDAHRVSINTMYKMKKCLVCGLELPTVMMLNTHLAKIHGLQNRFEGASPSSKTTKPSASKPENDKKISTCQICHIDFGNPELYAKHFNLQHSHKCYRCNKTWSTKESLMQHYANTHKMDKDECQICGTAINIGRPFIRHVKREHVKQFSIVLPKLKTETLKKWTKDLPKPPSPKATNGDKEKDKKMKEYIEVDGEKIILEVCSSDEEKETS